MWSRVNRAQRQRAFRLHYFPYTRDDCREPLPLASAQRAEGFDTHIETTASPLLPPDASYHPFDNHHGNVANAAARQHAAFLVGWNQAIARM